MPSVPRAAAVPAPRPVGTWLLAFAGLFLIGAAWSIALPYDGPPDELQHVLRAYAATDGQFISRDGKQTVPASLSPPGIGCFRWHLEKSAACAEEAGSVPGSEDDLSRISSNAAYYSPAYYLLCGWPIRIWPDFGGIIGARLLTAGFMSIMFACAFTVVAGLRRGRRLLTGLLLALTPVTLGLAGAVNPAGPEIAVGVALWVALIALVETGRGERGEQAGQDDRVILAERAPRLNGWIVALAGVSAAGLAVLRGFGLGWLLAIVVVMALGLSRDRFFALARSRPVWIGAGIALVGIAFGLYWRYAAPALDFDTGPSPSGALRLPQVLAQVLWDRLPFYAQGLVGLTSYGDVPQPQIYFFLWYAAAGCLVLLGIACLGWLARLRLVVIVLGSFVILAIPDINAIGHGWYLSQGRYALPFIAGAPLLAGYLLGRAGILADRRQAQLARFFALVLLPFQFVALWFTMIRFDRGVNPGVYPMSLTPYHGTWTPPAGVTLPLVLCAIGSLVVFGFVLWLSGLGRPEEPEAEASRPMALPGGVPV